MAKRYIGREVSRRTGRAKLQGKGCLKAMSTFTSRRYTIVRRTVAAALAISFVCAVHSCAYFNTLYNARKIYNEAEDIRERGGSERELKDKYKEVVTKTANIIGEYPNSRWVDDSLFLMGQALVRQGELNKGIRKFTELITNFPESKYVSRSLYWLAFAYNERKDYNQALVYVDRFLEDFPKHELRYRVMFLAGDINGKLEREEEALNFYARVADETSKRQLVEEAVLKSAEYYFEKQQWEKAAASYNRLLRKGLPWEERYDISLRLGKCLTNTGECRAALDIFIDLIGKTVSSKEEPPLVLGKASSYACMDSLEEAIGIYGDIIDRFPKSSFSAEAYYLMGIIYHERMDSLARAQEAFSKVGGEYASSDYASVALQKSNSLKRLIELESSAGQGVSPEQLAEKRFLAAEIQLTRLNKLETALDMYSALIDSFPETSYAPKAAYAKAWIYHRKMDETEKAVELYRAVASQYPRSPQAKGAVDQLGSLGMEKLKEQLTVYVDSALADTTGTAERLRRERQAAGDTLPADTLGSSGPEGGVDVPVDSVSAPPGSPFMRSPGDTEKRRPFMPGTGGPPAPSDSLSVPPGTGGPPAPSDSLSVPQPPDTIQVLPDSVRMDTLNALPDSTGAGEAGNRKEED